MKYFETLPIIDIRNQYFRNLFNKIMVSNVNINELISYEMKDYDTLPIISFKLYGTTDYWWVIALLNNIQNIEYDLPMEESRIDSLAEQHSREYKFSSSVLSSGIFDLSDATNTNKILTKSVSFKNENDQEVYCHVTPCLDFSYDEEENKEYIKRLQDYGDCSLQVNNVLTSSGRQWSFDFSVYVGVDEPEDLTGDPSPRKIRQHQDQVDAYNRITSIKYSYVIFSSPNILKMSNTAMYSKIYDVLLKENIKKKNIRLIRSQNIGQVVSAFINSLNDNTPYTKYYTEEINLLKNFNPSIIPSKSMVGTIDTEMFGADNLSVRMEELSLNSSEHVYVMPNITNSNLGFNGDLHVSMDNNIPVIHRSSNTKVTTDPYTNDIISENFNSGYSFMILDSGQKNTSLNREVLATGKVLLEQKYDGISGNYADIEIDDPRIANLSDVGAMLTATYTSNSLEGRQGNLGFQVIDTNTVRIWNTGNPIDCFYTIYINNIVEDVYNLNYESYVSLIVKDSLLTQYGYDNLVPFISLFLNSENINKTEYLHLVGNIGYKTNSNKLQFDIYNTGSYNFPFVGIPIKGTEQGNIYADEDGEELSFRLSSVNSADNINLYLIPNPNDITTLSDYSSYGIHILNATSVKVISNTFNRLNFKYCLITDYLQQGIVETQGNLTPAEVILDSFDEIIYNQDIKVLLTPIFEDGIPVDVGNFCYVINNLNKITVYNTGSACKFKWCLLKA